MLRSIYKNGGFYVGRYETGGFNEDKVVSKPDRGMKGDGDINSTYWYQMYRMQKEFAKDSKSVASTMIWGCQYDQVMKFIGNEIETVHFDRNLTDAPEVAGNNPLDKMKNIYGFIKKNQMLETGYLWKK